MARTRGPPPIATAVLVLLARHAAATVSHRLPTGAANARESTSSAVDGRLLGLHALHGVPNYPDPDSSGQLPKPDAHHLGVSSTQLQATQQACQHLLPNTGRAINAGSVQQCMGPTTVPKPSCSRC